MLRPRMNAPKFSIDRRANTSSTSVDPPSCPCMARNDLVWKNQLKISGPRLPSGSFRLCSIPALKPSNETPNPATRTFDMYAPRFGNAFLTLGSPLSRGFPSPSLLALLNHFVQIRGWTDLERSTLHSRMLGHQLNCVIQIPRFKHQ